MSGSVLTSAVEALQGISKGVPWLWPTISQECSRVPITACVMPHMDDIDQWALVQMIDGHKNDDWESILTKGNRSDHSIRDGVLRAHLCGKAPFLGSQSYESCDYDTAYGLVVHSKKTDQWTCHGLTKSGETLRLMDQLESRDEQSDLRFRTEEVTEAAWGAIIDCAMSPSCFDLRTEKTLVRYPKTRCQDPSNISEGDNTPCRPEVFGAVSLTRGSDGLVAYVHGFDQEPKESKIFLKATLNPEGWPLEELKRVGKATGAWR